MFVTLEGIDRSGKSTQALLLAEALGDQAISVREPGGTPAGEHLRSILKDPGVQLGPEAEALLFAAARAELARQVIRPALEQGRTVVCDRFLDSSLAYQGVARGLGVDRVRDINAFGMGDLSPDLTVLLEIVPSTAASRGAEDDRFEREGDALQNAVAGAYEELVAADPGRFVRIDAARDSQAVHADVLAAVREAGG
ncbi:MAG TPA: dTMP kinase [Thermoleophilaceae bacterium]|nr:dTMP kinase [Thermoleophilaceae bacterium]